MSVISAQDSRALDALRDKWGPEGYDIGWADGQWAAYAIWGGEPSYMAAPTLELLSWEIAGNWTRRGDR